MVVVESKQNEKWSYENLKFVHFVNVPLTIPAGEDFIVEFGITPGVKCSTRDWIGIFQEKWNSIESFVAYEWGIGRSADNKIRKIKFCAKFFKQRLSYNTRYQFVYISRHLEIFGMSSYFAFDEPLNETFNSTSTSPINSTESKFYDGTADNVRCQLQKLPFISNLITTCNLCRHLVSEPVGQFNNFVDKQGNEVCSQISKLDKRVDSLECLVDALITRVLYNEGVFEKSFSDVLESFSKKISEKEKFNNDNRHSDNCHSSMEEIIQNKEFALFEDQYCLLKAIIGHQEEKIQSLTAALCQNKLSEIDTLPRMQYDQDTVKLVKTEEKMLAQIMRINANCEQYTTEGTNPKEMNKVIKTINLFERSTAL